jgi:hypothetical protein
MAPSYHYILILLVSLFCVMSSFLSALLFGVARRGLGVFLVRCKMGGREIIRENTEI